MAGISKTGRLSDAQLVALSRATQREDGAICAPDGARGAAHRLGESLVKKGLAREIAGKPGMPVWRTDGDGRRRALVLTAAGRAAIGVADPEVNNASGADTSTRPSPAPATMSEVDARVIAKPGSVDPEPSPPTRGRRKAAAGVVATHASGAAVDQGAVPSPALASGESAPRRSGAVRNAVGDVICVEPDAMPPDPAALSFTTPSSAKPPRDGSKIGAVLVMLTRDGGAELGEIIGATGWLPHTARAVLTGLRKRGYEIERIKQEGEASRYRATSSCPRNHLAA